MRDINLRANVFVRLLSDKRYSYIVTAWFVFLSYLFLYFTFLYKTNFLPYVFDNNETFSNLMHTQNLFLFGFKSTFGLADESFSILKEAHPYVYTHQGNFPRLFSLLLYCLGARSAESQIGITTFTIGLSGIGFCYYFFSRYVSILFSSIFCILLMTDYVMFLQWQVNTWRVWHLFFFFSSFLCCHGLNGKHRKLFIAASILNFSCLFYMELAFAVFVFISCSFYQLFSQNISWKRKFINFCIFSFGAWLGIGILVAQDVAYMGWNKFLIDLAYTFTSRNQHSNSNTEFINQVTSFYSKNKIAFWQNFNSIEKIRSPNVLFNNFYRYCLLPYPSFLTLSSILVMLGSTLILLYSTFQRKYFIQRTFRYCAVSKYTLITLATNFFLLGLITLIIVSYPLSIGGITQIFIELTKPFSLMSMLLFGFLFFLYCNKYIYQSTKIGNSFYSLLIIFFCLSVGISYIFSLQNRYSASLAANILMERSLSVIGGTSGLPIIISAVLFISAPVPYYFKKFRIIKTFRLLMPFTLSTSAGFICAYLIFPGYILSGYMVRSCCFTVYFHMVLYAWLFYVLTKPLLCFLRSSSPLKHAKKLGSDLQIFVSIRLATSIVLLFFSTYLWLNFQWYYVHEFPPEDYNFIKLFKTSSFKNKSIVSNTYTAPFSFEGQGWAYYDPIFGNSHLANTRNDDSIYQAELMNDFRYLWFADSVKNPIYHKPDLFVCWQSYNFEQLGQAKPKCGDVPLINSLRKPNTQVLNVSELEHDKSSRDRWSILNLKYVD